jgi:hypothetical protein
MMGGGAFVLLKVGRPWPESGKQPEIRLAGLLKILAIGAPKPFGKTSERCIFGACRRCPLGMTNLSASGRFVI